MAFLNGRLPLSRHAAAMSTLRVLLVHVEDLQAFESYARYEGRDAKQSLDPEYARNCARRAEAALASVEASRKAALERLDELAAYFGKKLVDL